MFRFICASLTGMAWIWSILITLQWFNATAADPAPYSFPWVVGSWLFTWGVTAATMKD